jgi:hypothetical protein
MSTKISALTAASTIDAVADYVPIVTSSLSATQKINRNTFLGLSSAPVGLTDSQTLTNKILTSPTLNTPTVSSPTLSGTLTGTYTIGGTPTFPATVVTLTGSQTLTNKVLTAPTITNATLTTDAVTGFTTSNSGTLFGTLTATTGNGQFGGTLGVTGATTLSSTLAVTGTSTLTGQLSVQTGTAPPAAGATTSGIKVSSTANLGLFWGSGAPTFSAAQGAIYLRTDGSSTSTRLYVNTTGSTTWTNFTSAA